jgi:hypothetical protein
MAKKREKPGLNNFKKVGLFIVVFKKIENFSNESHQKNPHSQQG